MYIIWFRLFVTCIAPSAPQNVAAVNVTSSSITWIWDQPTNHSNKVTHYHIQQRHWNTWLLVVKNTTYTGMHYQVNGLSANTQYRFRVQAVTGSGNYGSWSDWMSWSTQPAGMPSTTSTVHASIAVSCIDNYKLMDSGSTSG